MGKVNGYPLATEIDTGDIVLGLQNNALVQFPFSLIIPDQSTNAGKFLQTDGDVTSWADATTAVHADGILAVSATAGSDTAGTKGRLDLPFRTLPPAQTAAGLSGTIQVYPGIYTTTAVLGAGLVNWDLASGTSINGVLSSGAAPFSLFGDANNVMSVRVTGRGVLSMSGTPRSQQLGDITAVVDVRNASSDFRVEAESLTCAVTTSTQSDVYIIIQENGKLYVDVDTMSITYGYYTSAIYWVNGEMHVRAGSLTCVASTDTAAGPPAAIWSIVTSTPTGDAFIDIDHIASLSSAVVAMSGQDANAKMWVTSRLIEGVNGAVICQSGKLYVTAQKIVDNAASGTAYAVGSSGGLLWVDALKLTGIVGSIINVSGGTTLVRAMQLEDSAATLTQGILVAGGTLELEGAVIVMGAGNGLSISAGTCRLKRCRIDTSASASGYPINKTGGTLILEDCTLIAHAGQDSIHATNAQNVYAYGSRANVAKNANITIIGPSGMGLQTDATTIV